MGGFKPWRRSEFWRIPLQTAPHPRPLSHKRGEGRTKRWGAVHVAVTVASLQASRLTAGRRDACTIISAISTNRDTTRISARVPRDLIAVVSQQYTQARHRSTKAVADGRTGVARLQFLCCICVSGAWQVGKPTLRQAGSLRLRFGVLCKHLGNNDRCQPRAKF
jgi:hypothetical protein